MKRFKRRYLALQIDTASVPTELEFMDALWGSVTQLYGEYGASLANLVLISYDAERKLAVLRANLSVVNNVRAAITTITSIAGKNMAVHVIAVSGTIKALSEKL